MNPYDPATRLTLISHAATPGQRRAAFPDDEAVSEQELAEVAAVGWVVPRAQRVLTAPERRAQQTTRALGLQAEVADDLRDCDYGSWKGCELDELSARDAEGVMMWLSDPCAAPHGGESIMGLMERIGEWMKRLRDAGHVVAVTHPAVIRAAIVAALEAPAHAFWRVDIAPLSLTDLRFNGRVWTLRSANGVLGADGQ